MEASPLGADNSETSPLGADNIELSDALDARFGLEYGFSQEGPITLGRLRTFLEGVLKDLARFDQEEIIRHLEASVPRGPVTDILRRRHPPYGVYVNLRNKAAEKWE